MESLEVIQKLADSFVAKFSPELFETWRNGANLAEHEKLCRSAFDFALSAGFGNALRVLQMAGEPVHVAETDAPVVAGGGEFVPIESGPAEGK